MEAQALQRITADHDHARLLLMSLAEPHMAPPKAWAENIAIRNRH